MDTKDIDNQHSHQEGSGHEIDLSKIKILDTSKGDNIEINHISNGNIHTFKCLSCGFRYEGKLIDEKCPRCGSEDIKDV